MAIGDGVGVGVGRLKDGMETTRVKAELELSPNFPLEILN